MKRLRKSTSSSEKVSYSRSREKERERKRRTDSKVAQPLTRLFHVLVQPPQHNARVLARQVVLGLTNVQRDETRTLPEAEQRRRNTVRHAEVVEVLGLTLAQPLQEGGHLSGVANADSVRRERGRGRDLCRLGERLNFEFGRDFVEVEELARVERIEGLDRAGTVAHLGVVGVDGDADDAGAGERGEVVVLVLWEGGTSE